MKAQLQNILLNFKDTDGSLTQVSIADIINAGFPIDDDGDELELVEDTAEILKLD